MKRSDKIKLNFTRNWNLPGQERLTNWFKPSEELKTQLRNGITWLNTDDIAIYTTADNYIEWTILSTGTYEDEIGKLIKISLTQGDNALDIGGNIGLQSLRMSARVGSTGKILAFEPLEYLQEKFNRNVTLNKAGNIQLFPVALSDAESEANFAINNTAWNQGTFSLANQYTDGETQNVKIKVADQIAEIQALDNLALIKIDVEGFEYQVLKGLKQTLQKHKPRIIFEYDSNYWINTGQNITECCQYLKNLNYQLFEIHPSGCEIINNVKNIQSGNLFCIPE